jgi:transcriptional regulator with XRE-family HTH domain
MPKILVRIISLLLVPCLLAEPSASGFASAFQNSSLSPMWERVGVSGHVVRNYSVNQQWISEQALAATLTTHPLLHSVIPILLRFGRICGARWTVPPDAVVREVPMKHSGTEPDIENFVTVYHSLNIDLVPLVEQYGLFADMAIETVLSEERGYWAGCPVLAFRVPSRFIQEGRLSAEAKRARLPETLKAELIRTLKEVPDDAVGRSLRIPAKKLLRAEKKGRLAGFDPSTLDIEKTLAINERLVKVHKLSKETFETLRQHLEMREGSKSAAPPADALKPPEGGATAKGGAALTLPGTYRVGKVILRLRRALHLRSKGLPDPLSKDPAVERAVREWTQKHVAWWWEDLFLLIRFRYPIRYVLAHPDPYLQGDISEAQGGKVRLGFGRKYSYGEAINQAEMIKANKVALELRNITTNRMWATFTRARRALREVLYWTLPALALAAWAVYAPSPHRHLVLSLLSLAVMLGVAVVAGRLPLALPTMPIHKEHNNNPKTSWAPLTTDGSAGPSDAAPNRLPAEIEVFERPGLNTILREPYAWGTGLRVSLNAEERRHLEQIVSGMRETSVEKAARGQEFTGVYQSSPPVRLAKSLKVVGVKAGESLLDLGSGNGLVVFVSAGVFGARSIGWELNATRLANSQRCQEALEKAGSLKPGQTELHLGDYLAVPWGSYDFIYYYSFGAKTNVSEIIQKAARETKPGARLVVLGLRSHQTFDYQDFRPLVASPNFAFRRYPELGVWTFTRKISPQTQAKTATRPTKGQSSSAAATPDAATAPGSRLRELEEQYADDPILSRLSKKSRRELLAFFVEYEPVGRKQKGVRLPFWSPEKVFQVIRWGAAAAPEYLRPTRLLSLSQDQPLRQHPLLVLLRRAYMAVYNRPSSWHLGGWTDALQRTGVNPEIVEAVRRHAPLPATQPPAPPAKPTEAVRFEELIKEFKRMVLANDIATTLILPLVRGSAVAGREAGVEERLWQELERRSKAVRDELDRSYSIKAHSAFPMMTNFFMWEKMVCRKDVLVPLAVAAFEGESTWQDRLNRLLDHLSRREDGSYDADEFIDLVDKFVTDLNAQGFFQRGKDRWGTLLKDHPVIVPYVEPLTWENVNQIPSMLTLDDVTVKDPIQPPAPPPTGPSIQRRSNPTTATARAGSVGRTLSLEEPVAAMVSPVMYQQLQRLLSNIDRGTLEDQPPFSLDNGSARELLTFLKFLRNPVKYRGDKPSAEALRRWRPFGGNLSEGEKMALLTARQWQPFAGLTEQERAWLQEFLLHLVDLLVNWRAFEKVSGEEIALLQEAASHYAESTPPEGVSSLERVSKVEIVMGENEFLQSHQHYYLRRVEVPGHPEIARIVATYFESTDLTQSMTAYINPKAHPDDPVRVMHSGWEQLPSSEHYRFQSYEATKAFQRAIHSIAEKNGIDEKSVLRQLKTDRILIEARAEQTHPERDFKGSIPVFIIPMDRVRRYGYPERTSEWRIQRMQADFTSEIEHLLNPGEEDAALEPKALPVVVGGMGLRAAISIHLPYVKISEFAKRVVDTFTCMLAENPNLEKKDYTEQAYVLETDRTAVGWPKRVLAKIFKIAAWEPEQYLDCIFGHGLWEIVAREAKTPMILQPSGQWVVRRLNPTGNGDKTRGSPPAAPAAKTAAPSYQPQAPSGPASSAAAPTEPGKPAELTAAEPETVKAPSDRRRKVVPLAVLEKLGRLEDAEEKLLAGSPRNLTDRQMIIQRALEEDLSRTGRIIRQAFTELEKNYPERAMMLSLYLGTHKHVRRRWSQPAIGRLFAVERAAVSAQITNALDWIFYRLAKDDQQGRASEVLTQQEVQEFRGGFGPRLAKIRRRRGLTQVALAENAGTSMSYISVLEKGKRMPNLSTCRRLAKALQVLLAYLVDPECPDSLEAGEYAITGPQLAANLQSLAQVRKLNHRQWGIQAGGMPTDSIRRILSRLPEGRDVRIDRLYQLACGLRCHLWEVLTWHQQSSKPPNAAPPAAAPKSPFNPNETNMAIFGVNGLFAKLHYIFVEPGGVVHDLISLLVQRLKKGSETNLHEKHSIGFPMRVFVGTVLIGGVVAVAGWRGALSMAAAILIGMAANLSPSNRSDSGMAKPSTDQSAILLQTLAPLLILGDVSAIKKIKFDLPKEFLASVVYSSHHLERRTHNALATLLSLAPFYPLAEPMVLSDIDFRQAASYLFSAVLLRSGQTQVLYQQFFRQLREYLGKAPEEQMKVADITLRNSFRNVRQFIGLIDRTYEIGLHYFPPPSEWDGTCPKSEFIVNVKEGVLHMVVYGTYDEFFREESIHKELVGAEAERELERLGFINGKGVVGIIMGHGNGETGGVAEDLLPLVGYIGHSHPAGTNLMPSVMDTDNVEHLRDFYSSLLWKGASFVSGNQKQKSIVLLRMLTSILSPSWLHNALTEYPKIFEAGTIAMWSAIKELIFPPPIQNWHTCQMIFGAA